MRETELWRRLSALVGSDYVKVWAESVVHGQLENRTVSEALADGLEIRLIWLAACEQLEVPQQAR